MTEKRFASADVGLVMPRRGPGYLTTVRSTGARRIWAGLRMCPRRDVWWTPCPKQTLLDQARDAASHGPVELCPEGIGNDHLAGLGAAFAEHLADCRGPGAVVGPCSRVRPADTPETVCLPHLVWAEGEERDCSVWEVLPASAVEGQLGVAVRRGELAHIEQNLEVLLELKRRSRAPGGLIGTPARARLARLLRGGRYLSIRLVLHHPDLFHALIEEEEIR